MLFSEESSAICVQRFDGLRNSAIHTTYRISLRSSSIREPRYPLLRVVSGLVCLREGGFPPEDRQVSSVDGLGFGCCCGVGLRSGRRRWASQATGRSRNDGQGSQGVCSLVSKDNSMILPQVHLRKPCYDFSFL